MQFRTYVLSWELDEEGDADDDEEVDDDEFVVLLTHVRLPALKQTVSITRLHTY